MTIGDIVTFICAINSIGYDLFFGGLNQLDTLDTYINNNGDKEIATTLTITKTTCVHCVATFGNGSDPIVSDDTCVYARG